MGWWRSVMRKRLFTIILLFLFVVIVAFVLNEFIRETIAPIVLSWVWHVWLMSSGIPEVMIWVLFLATIPIIAIFSLIQGQASLDEDSPAPQSYRGRVATLAHWIRQSSSGSYFRRRLARHLSQLARDTLGYREQLTEKEARERLADDQLQVSPDVKQYLEAGWRRQRVHETIEHTTFWQSLYAALTQRFSGEDNQVLWYDPTLEEVVEFLEAELEVTRDR
jgi:hypothetical protein